MKNKVKLGVALALVSSLAACNSKPNYEAAKITWVNEKPIPFNPAVASGLPNNVANFVFFRENDKLNEQTAVNVAINDRYNTSLRGGNYTAVPSCAGNTKISTAVTMKKLNDLLFNRNVLDAVPKKNYYFQVSVGKDGNSKARQVSEAEALRRLKNKKLQTHMVNRVDDKNCAPYEARTPDPVPVSKDKLFGVYYFDFDVPTMSPAEKQRAFNLGKKIVATGATYEVFLSGHADPMGSKLYNKKLSRKRTIDVAKTLAQAGVDPSKIKLGSFGEERPVLLTCNGIKKRSSRNGCNLKNRRVEALVKLNGVASTMEDIDKIR